MKEWNIYIYIYTPMGTDTNGARDSNPKIQE